MTEIDLYHCYARTKWIGRCHNYPTTKKNKFCWIHTKKKYERHHQEWTSAIKNGTSTMKTNITQCNSCLCMTKTTKNKCGKCNHNKNFK